jgi:ribosomal protein L11 methyltransferase
VSVEVPLARAEEARAGMLELFPGGFEEVDHADGIELVAYTDAQGEERMWRTFGGASAADVADDWEDRWREFHRPVQVGRLWIGQPWQTPADGVTVVVIDPGRAFGTGAHPTTRLVLSLLDDEPRGSVLDIGCGSGVVAIAAAKLGFAPVIAIDSEDAAVEATARNAAANAVEVRAERRDARVGVLPKADVAVANITRGLVEAVAPRLRSPRYVASGYLMTEPESLPGYRHLRRMTEDGWAADLFARQ